MQYLLGAVLGLCFFMLPMWAYRRGLKDGLAINQGKEIAPIRSPVQMVRNYKESREIKKENDLIIQGFANLMAYNGEPQDKGGDKT